MPRVGARSRVLAWTFGVGFVCFAAGFFGPIIFTPEANQGPLLGIFITGPIGLVLGLLVGIWKETRRGPEEPDSPAPSLPSWESLIAHPLARVIAGLIALILLVRGIEGLRAGAGRGAAAAIVIAVILGFFAGTGRVPDWARRNR
ncbi:MAG TPA: hypothetical protein VJU15_04360 [Gemmatimonadales bacterium]|nr:hypothetical protein [Gemmatimonadales bacterium]